MYYFFSTSKIEVMMAVHTIQIEDFLLRFPHIAEQIFEQLDNRSLTKCRGVSKLWRRFIDVRNLAWIRIVNIPSGKIVYLPK